MSDACDADKGGLPDGAGLVLTFLGGGAALGLAGGALTLGLPVGLAVLLWLIGAPVLALGGAAGWLRWRGRRSREADPAGAEIASDRA
ncbi:hypothetical protein [Pseudooceanicola sp. 200-1SW]|uniref:hypothetical protein n=1 Tax=Pseudooceanicola sp. 200-1SW TaxID=3425949 RepID=UPI003D7F2B9E